MTDEDFKRIESKIDRLLAHLGATQQTRTASPTGGGGEVASDSELDGQYGDKLIKKDPPRYKGPPLAPCNMSEGSPEWLDALASFCDWRASRDDETNAVDDKGRPKSYWAKKDAALARGWARRIRERGNAPLPERRRPPTSYGPQGTAGREEHDIADDDPSPF